MIVRHETDGSLVMISQNDHAKVSGLCASHWGNASYAKPQPYRSCVLAALLHDLVWLREETSPWFDPATGTAINYLNVPSELQINEYRWVNEWLTKLDPYAALLVSKHRTGIWKSRYGLMKKPQYAARKLSAEIEQLVIRNHAEQEAAAVPFDTHEVTTNYILLQIWDLLSLYVCSNEHLEEVSYEPVPTSYGASWDESITLTPVEQRRISVSPYPFDQSSLDVGLVYRRLPATRFTDPGVFERAYFNATPQLATFTFFDPAAD
jgi:hypothetical protein